MVMKRGDQFEAKELSKDVGSLPEVYVDDMLMPLKYYVDEDQSHLWIIDEKVCEKCQHKPCLYFCPVSVYCLCGDCKDKVQISYQACIECGSCRVGCPYSNIGWKHPRGGFGVAYKFG